MAAGVSMFTEDNVWYDEEDHGTECQMPEKVTYGFRPWGYYKNLIDTDYCKVKKIIVKPGCRLSYQYHFKRSEDWIIVKGNGIVTLDDKLRDVKILDRIRIPSECKHRIENNGDEDLIFIEVQTGTYFGEDDIVRIEDDYGRK